MASQKVFMKMVVIGDSGVGKTTLLQQYINQRGDKSNKPTIGADLFKEELEIDGQKVAIQIWDTAGQERFHALGFSFYKGADCCALVYDVTNPKSFESLEKWKKGFIDNSSPSDTSTFPFCVFGNKADKVEERAISEEEEQKWCEENHIKDHFSTSAKTAMNVKEAFYSMIEKALARAKKASMPKPGSIIGKDRPIRGTKLQRGGKPQDRLQNVCEC
ncbi:unnamed protein product [Moneuplotes crassus]|uniref:Ras-related protein Rab-7b n=1 Tax=Euplotes crassus TaxID=5936 RepID=A0AAD2D3K3_EUPCR|nr:unnamed protein product [Moneuplotes crassus]